MNLEQPRRSARDWAVVSWQCRGEMLAIYAVHTAYEGPILGGRTESGGVANQ